MRMRTPPRAPAALVTLLAVLAAAPLAAFDLTGTWEGTLDCAEFDGAKSRRQVAGSVMRISQAGDVITASLDDLVFFKGRAIEDLAKPEKGEIVFYRCGTDNQPLAGGQGEIVRAKVKTRAGTERASLRGLSIVEGATRRDGTCRYTFRRRDTTDASVPTCP
jgi:hypothetical protein